MKKTGIYIHIPFCRSKCVYCDFLSAPPTDKNQMIKYISALAEEIEIRAKKTEASLKTVDSVFFGGGTPTILPARELIFLLDVLRKSFKLEADAEITVECNPGTADAAKLKALKQAGVNRLSFGLQSANDKELKLLGRIHTFAEFSKSFKLAREAGFENINIDIISAIPGQTLKSFETTLQKVTALKPEHLSCYSLILEEGTPLCEQIEEYPHLPDEDVERQMYDRAKQFLEENGYMQYEISNYCLKSEKKDFRCRHNLGYWDRNVYFGFGAGAASFDGEVRYKNIADIEDYIKLRDREDKEEREVVPPEDAKQEFMYLGLRKTEGISAQDFEKSFDIPLEDVFGEVLKRHIEDGLLEKTDKGYRFTSRGVEVSNIVLADYISDT